LRPHCERWKELNGGERHRSEVMSFSVQPIMTLCLCTGWIGLHVCFDMFG
jgi:hypothetical protein